MKKLGKRLLITGYIGIAVATIFVVLMVINWIQNGVTSDDTRAIVVIRAILIGIGCYFLGLGQAEEMVQQEVSHEDKG